MPAKNRQDLKTADWKTLRLHILQRDALMFITKPKGQFERMGII